MLSTELDETFDFTENDQLKAGKLTAFKGFSRSLIQREFFQNGEKTDNKRIQV